MPTDPGYRTDYTSPTRKKAGATQRTTVGNTGGNYKSSWNAAGPGYGGVADIYRGMVGSSGGQMTEQGWRAFQAGLTDPSLLPPIGPGNAPSAPGSGSRSGGGGGSAMTQAMFNQMVAALAQRGQQQTYTPLNLPAFQGQNLPAFNAAPYTQATQALGQAVAADTANVNQNAQNTTNTLNANYTNSYANTPVVQNTAQQPVGVGLTGGGGGAQQAANDVNAAGGSDQAAFSNLLNVLAAAANQSQQSRLGQVSMDKTTALNQIGAQNLGLGAGINMAQTQAQNQWGQQDAERRYQNSLLQQQWAREQAMQNNQGINQVNQANVQQRNTQMQTMLQPLLDLIANGRGLNTASLTALLNRS